MSQRSSNEFKFPDKLKTTLLGRSLTSDEAQQLTHHVLRITSIFAPSGRPSRHTLFYLRPLR